MAKDFTTFKLASFNIRGLSVNRTQQEKKKKQKSTQQKEEKEKQKIPQWELQLQKHIDKRQSLINLAKKESLHVICLQETKQNRTEEIETEIIEYEGYNLYLLSNIQKNEPHGLGFLVCSKLTVTKTEIVSDRVAYIDLGYNFCMRTKKKIRIVNVHCPSFMEKGSKTPEKKFEEFYTELQSKCDPNTSEYDVFICGDFNSRLGKCEEADVNIGFHKYIGRHSPGQMNENGEKLANFLVNNEFYVCNTRFDPGSDKKHSSWISQPIDKKETPLKSEEEVKKSEDTNRHLIDFILCRQNRVRYLIEGGTIKQEIVNSDHDPVFAEFMVAEKVMNTIEKDVQEYLEVDYLTKENKSDILWSQRMYTSAMIKQKNHYRKPEFLKHYIVFIAALKLQVEEVLNHVLNRMVNKGFLKNYYDFKDCEDGLEWLCIELFLYGVCNSVNEAFLNEGYPVLVADEITCYSAYFKVKGHNTSNNAERLHTKPEESALKIYRAKRKEKKDGNYLFKNENWTDATLFDSKLCPNKDALYQKIKYLDASKNNDFNCDDWVIENTNHFCFIESDVIPRNSNAANFTKLKQFSELGRKVQWEMLGRVLREDEGIIKSTSKCFKSMFENDKQDDYTFFNSLIKLLNAILPDEGLPELEQLAIDDSKWEEAFTNKANNDGNQNEINMDDNANKRIYKQLATIKRQLIMTESRPRNASDTTNMEEIAAKMNEVAAKMDEIYNNKAENDDNASNHEL